jgi:hypothetical protein
VNTSAYPVPRVADAVRFGTFAPFARFLQICADWPDPPPGRAAPRCQQRGFRGCAPTRPGHRGGRRPRNRSSALSGSVSWLGARVPNGVGCAGCPCSRTWWGHPSCGWSGPRWAGFLAPEGVRSGLGAPMPGTIALVVWGRWRPTPGRMSLGTPSGHDARAVVTGGLGVAGAHRRGAPAGRVRRIDGDDRDALFGGHGGQAGA